MLDFGALPLCLPLRAVNDWLNQTSRLGMCCLKVMFAVFPQPVLIMLIRVLKGNPYLVNWFNPSISVVHGLVSVTDKCNMISEALPADAEGTAAWSRGKSRNSRPRYQVSPSPWRLLSHLLPVGINML